MTDCDLRACSAPIADATSQRCQSRGSIRHGFQLEHTHSALFAEGRRHQQQHTASHSLTTLPSTSSHRAVRLRSSGCNPVLHLPELLHPCRQLRVSLHHLTHNHTQQGGVEPVLAAQGLSSCLPVATQGLKGRVAVGQACRECNRLAGNDNSVCAQPLQLEWECVSESGLCSSATCCDLPFC